MFFLKKHKISSKQKDTKKYLEEQIKILLNDVPSKQFDVEYFFEKTFIILENYNCSFGYQNKNSKKHGHVKLKTNLKTGEQSLELKIERNENIAGKIYTIIHELTHLINNHLTSKHLTSKQKEVVADTVALMFIKSYSLEEELLKSKMATKWNINAYSKDYIQSMTISKQRANVVIEEIKKSFKFLSENFI